MDEQHNHKNSIQDVKAKYRVSTYDGSLATRIILFVVLLSCIVWGLILGVGNPKKTDHNIKESPIGEIRTPSYGSYTGDIVKITGYIRNINTDDNFVWLIADESYQKIYWPLKQVVADRGSFSTSINVRKFRNFYNLSMYIVDYATNNELQSWLKSEQYDGFPMLKEKFKLYSVKLWKK